MRMSQPFSFSSRLSPYFPVVGHTIAVTIGFVPAGIWHSIDIAQPMETVADGLFIALADDWIAEPNENWVVLDKQIPNDCRICPYLEDELLFESV